MLLVYDDENIHEIEVPLVRQIPVLNDQNEVIRWVYEYAHLALNISNTPAYRDAILIVDSPRVVFDLFSQIQCQWEAEDEAGLLTKDDFSQLGPQFTARDDRIENAIWQTLFTAPLYVEIILTV